MGTDVGIRRLQRDLKVIQEDAASNIFVTPRRDDLSVVDALVLGPADTPYDGALLHFQLNILPTYPMNPPEAGGLWKTLGLNHSSLLAIARFAFWPRILEPFVCIHNSMQMARQWASLVQTSSRGFCLREFCITLDVDVYWCDITIHCNMNTLHEYTWVVYYTALLVCR